MRDIRINDRWDLAMPDHRADQWDRWGGIWEQERIDAMWQATCRATTRAGTAPVVFDIGAEQGDLPCLWASWGARIVMVEPSLLMWPTIRATFEANDLVETVAGCFVGFAGMEEADGDEPWPLTAGPWPFCTHREVIPEPGFGHLNEAGGRAVCTINGLALELDTYPDVITVDVEGAELSVMAGALHTLEMSRPDVLISVHPEFMADRYGVGPDDLHDLMVDNGYAVKWIDTDHEEHWLYVPEERS